jgi:hypothetical protein
MSDPAPVAVGAAQSYIEGQYGGPTDEQDTEMTLGVTPSRIVDNDPDALALTIINLGANTVYVMFDLNPTTTRGIQLNASGGFVSFNVNDDQTLPTRQWYGVTASGTSDIFAIRTRRFALT